VVVLVVAERRRPVPTPMFRYDRQGPLAGGVVLWEAVQQILAAGLLMTSSSFNGAPSLARSGYAAGQAGLWCPGTGREEVTPGAVDVGAGCGEVVRWGEAIR
jgi:hypothetical protein